MSIGLIISFSLRLIIENKGGKLFFLFQMENNCFKLMKIHFHPISPLKRRIKFIDKFSYSVKYTFIGYFGWVIFYIWIEIY